MVTVFLKIDADQLFFSQVLDIIASGMEIEDHGKITEIDSKIQCARYAGDRQPWNPEAR